MPGVDGKNAVNCNCMIMTAIKKANERVAVDEYISGTVEGVIVVDKECDLMLSVDDIGGCTSQMCHRAVAVTFMQNEGDQDVAPPPATTAKATTATTRMPSLTRS